MLQVNLANGDTHVFNMEQADDASNWTRLSADPRWQDLITGVSLIHEGRHFAVPRPSRCRSVRYEHRFIRSGAGEVVIVYANNMKIDMVLWLRKGSVTLEVERAGRLVHHPDTQGGNPPDDMRKSPRHADGGNAAKGGTHAHRTR